MNVRKRDEAVSASRPQSRPRGDGLRLRSCEPSDVHHLSRLIRSTIDACYPRAYPPEAVDFFKQYHSEEVIAERAATGCTVVVERDGGLIGTGTLVDDQITAVFVSASVQGQGVGTHIMRFLEGEAAAAGLGAVRLDASLPSKRFYERLGYVTLEAASLPVANGKTLDFHRMQKAL